MRWWRLGVLVALGWGCTVPGIQDTEAALPPIPAGKGQVVLSWAAESGKTLLGSAWASAAADAYELVLTGASGTRGYSITAGSGQAVSVDPGTYRAVVLAGIKRSSGSSTALLVGSAVAEGVTVVEGARSKVNLVLKSVDLGWTATAAVWSQPVTIQATGATRNPRVGMSLAGTTTALRPRFKCADLWSSYKDTTVSGTPDAWAAEASATVPASGTGFTVELAGAGLVLQADDGTWSPLAGTTVLTWCWPSRPDLADTHPLVPYTAFSVAAGPPPTGVEVSLAWE